MALQGRQWQSSTDVDAWGILTNGLACRANLAVGTYKHGYHIRTLADLPGHLGIFGALQTDFGVQTSDAGRHCEQYDSGVRA
jgi:hypothetical protein